MTRQSGSLRLVCEATLEMDLSPAQILTNSKDPPFMIMLKSNVQATNGQISAA